MTPSRKKPRARPRVLTPLEREILGALKTPHVGVFTRHHYRLIGGVLAAEAEDHRALVERLAEKFARLFTKDSPRFNRKRWLETCGL